MPNYGVSYPSGPGISRPPAIRPAQVARPAYNTWHLTVYDVANRDEEGYVFDTLTDEQEALSRIRGRANTLEREGYEKVSVIGNRAFMLIRGKEVLLVTMMACYCGRKG